MKSYGAFGGYRPWPYKGEAPPNYPYKYGDVFFSTQEQRDTWRRYYNAATAAARNGFPSTDKGIAEYRRLRSALDEDKQFKRLDRKIHAEANAEIRKKYGLHPTGALAAQYREEFNKRKAAKWKLQRRSGLE